MDDRERYEFYADPANRVPVGPPVKRRKPPMTEILSVRCDETLVAAVERLADAWGISVSDWVRAAVRREECRQRAKWLDGHRHELQVVPDSGRAIPSRAIPSSLSLLKSRSFACPHFSIGGGIVSASCGTCGPLSAVA